MPRPCPMCGNALHAEDVRGGLITCPACGTAVSEHADGRIIDLDAARRKVRWPAIGLMTAGGLVILSGMALPAFVGVAVVAGDLGRPGTPDRMEGLIGIAAIAMIGLMALLVGGGVIFGGYRMYHLRSWAMAFVASVLSTGSIMGCCFFSVFGLLMLPAFPIGIWAMVILCDANVKAAFR